MENNIEKANNERRNQIKKNADSYKVSTRKTGYNTLTNIDLCNTYEECVYTVALITKDGEFIANQRGDKCIWDISINPNYDLHQSIKRTNWFLIVSGGLTLLFIATTTTFSVLQFMKKDYGKSLESLDSLKIEVRQLRLLQERNKHEGLYLQKRDSAK